MTNQDNYCVIMGGGIGSRFWPFSRKTLPKQFLDFFGTGRSLLQQTFDRFQKVIPTENILIVTNAMYADLVKEQLPELDEKQILLEPARRNTAPCIAWASYHIRALNPNANIVVAPSDHLILKEDEFLAAIEKGLDFVSRSERLLTLGIKPNRPETGYGYIQIDEPAGGNFYKVKTFTEKPELELAKVFVESGERNHNLNTPAFVFSGRIVDGTVHMDSGAKAVHIVAIEAAAAVAVRLCEKQIPYRVQNVHFKFIVMVRIGIRVNEDLEIVVKVDDRIAFC